MRAELTGVTMNSLAIIRAKKLADWITCTTRSVIVTTGPDVCYEYLLSLDVLLISFDFLCNGQDTASYTVI